MLSFRVGTLQWTRRLIQEVTPRVSGNGDEKDGGEPDELGDNDEELISGVVKTREEEGESTPVSGVESRRIN